MAIYSRTSAAPDSLSFRVRYTGSVEYDNDDDDDIGPFVKYSAWNSENSLIWLAYTTGSEEIEKILCLNENQQIIMLIDCIR
ncbi:hypothetical protein DERF_000890 [Dermatophagoides farinae]|uniref:Uncharacterized protein n=1 Tax=Dermatophagoides farinae TaxID=6954 RepID=A0A922I8C4_DERFA|nr:hypothetical protein DERF_000890 [Dermatophagoides farinae]